MLKNILDFSDWLMIFRWDNDNAGLIHSSPFLIVGTILFFTSVLHTSEQIFLTQLITGAIIFSIPLIAIIISGITWWVKNHKQV